MTAEGDIQKREIGCSLDELKPVEICLVQSEAQYELWDTLVNRYHYLGHNKTRGRRLRYLIYGQGRVLGAVGWKSGSLKVDVRDCFIGWSAAQRKQYLDHLICNYRFLILDWVRVKNLASYVLARNIRLVVTDWQSHYGVRPFLLETFVDPARHYHGSSYRAAGWQYVGKTKGYEKLHEGYRYHGKIKEVYVYAVEPEFRRIIGCQRRSCSQERSWSKNREGMLRMMIQEVGYDPALIDWAGIDSEMIESLAAELVEFHALFTDCFYRIEQRLLSWSYLNGLLSDIQRKNLEAIALAFLGTKAVRCQQNFLSRYLWDDGLMLERYRELLSAAIGEEDAMHTVDSSEMQKKGKESVGVAYQYCGRLGKTENCQSGVFTGYTSRIGYGLVGRQLYMPQCWFSDEYAERRRKCGVPAELHFQTKIEIALELLESQIQEGQLKAKWVGCDSFFGRDSGFRDVVAGWGLYYLAEIPSDTLLWPVDGSEEGQQPAFEVSKIAKSKQIEWQLMVLAEGAKGPIVAEVSFRRVRENADGKPGEERWLIIRRLEGGKLKYYLCNAPKDIEPDELKRVLTMRWPIEQCFEDGKKYLGMDHYEHRTWNSWQRHMLYVFLAMFFLLRLRLKYKKNSNAHSSSGSAIVDHDLRSTATR